MGLHRRLERLEPVSKSGAPCPACGFDGGWSKVTPQVVWEEEDSGPEHCPECGRALVINVVWEDSPEAPA